MTKGVGRDEEENELLIWQKKDVTKRVRQGEIILQAASLDQLHATRPNLIR
jgi:hypothetical protein